MAGLDLLAKAIREGTFEQVDLTLLSVDEETLPVSLRMRLMPLCKNPPFAGEPVMVAIPEGTALSHVMSPLFIRPLTLGIFSRTSQLGAHVNQAATLKR